MEGKAVANGQMISPGIQLAGFAFSQAPASVDGGFFYAININRRL
jgi:hypothetical protein